MFLSWPQSLQHKSNLEASYSSRWSESEHTSLPFPTGTCANQGLSSCPNDSLPGKFWLLRLAYCQLLKWNNNVQFTKFMSLFSLWYWKEAEEALWIEIVQDEGSSTRENTIKPSIVITSEPTSSFSFPPYSELNQIKFWICVMRQIQAQWVTSYIFFF